MALLYQPHQQQFDVKFMYVWAPLLVTLQIIKFCWSCPFRALNSANFFKLSTSGLFAVVTKSPISCYSELEATSLLILFFLMVIDAFLFATSIKHAQQIKCIIRFDAFSRQCLVEIFFWIFWIMLELFKYLSGTVLSRKKLWCSG